jgi:hypothetical protein
MSYEFASVVPRTRIVKLETRPEIERKGQAARKLIEWLHSVELEDDASRNNSYARTGAAKKSSARVIRAHIWNPETARVRKDEALDW